MMRLVHRWPGLLALALVLVIALSGAVLSVFPAIEAVSAPTLDSSLTVADLASRVQAVHPGVEQIRRSPSGTITAWWFEGGAPGSAVVDPATGRDVASADPSPVERWVKDLHRSLFLGDGGRIVVIIGAVAMLLLALSGALLVARKTGGWRFWLAPLRGPLAGRLHTEIARIAVVGLLLSALTSFAMSAQTFELIRIEPSAPATLAEVSGLTGLPLDQMPALIATPVASLTDLTFPYPGDATDIFTLTTDLGSGTVDQGTGQLLSWADQTLAERIVGVIMMLHTGQGAAVLGLLLGLAALSVPVLGTTGVLVWLAARRGRPRIRHNHAAGRADTVILVGSEGGSTWGFAATLHKALTDAGQAVHVTPMAGFDPRRYAKAQRFVVMAATYGNGDAPASAKGFLTGLGALKSVPKAPLAVLGFGDRSFPAFCAYAEAIRDLATDKGWPELTAYDTVDRQSPQDFARWGAALGQAMGIALSLTHQPVLPRVQALTLISRDDYGAEVQAPTAILRFALPPLGVWQRLSRRGFARFEAGDLLGVLPDGSPLPRLYSLASARRDGFIEIVVRKQPGGLCSTQLMALEPGQTLQAYLRRNPAFHAGRDPAPLLLIGAGTGIGPLAGFIRANTRHRAVQLFFGLRHNDSDLLYGDALRDWQDDGRLTELVTAQSRGQTRHYVQDALRNHAAEVAQAVVAGARVMVCGGRDMAQGVREALAEILLPLGLTPATLKAEGRYVEDIY